MRTTFFQRSAIFILAVVCFCTPLILQGARAALANMKNNVKDWLPASFQETRDMEWFWVHFMGERFIVVSWPECTGGNDDQTYHLFKKKLTPAIPPSRLNQPVSVPLSKDPGSTWLERSYPFIGDSLGLYTVSNEHFNWGGQQEKWLRGKGGTWYYIVPDGKLFQLEGSIAPLPSLGRHILQRCGFNQLNGKLMADFGAEDGPWYYHDTSRLAAQLFKQVSTGPDFLRDMTKQSASGVQDIDEVEALKRLEGVMFGPARTNGRQTAFVVTMTDAAIEDFHIVLSRGLLGRERGKLYKIAEECGISEQVFHLGGPPVDNVAIDEEGTVTLVRLVSFCVILGLGLAFLSFRSWTATIIMFFTGGLSAALGMAIVGWWGTTPDAIMMSMPALVYVLGISGAVHLINYYREAVDEHGVDGAPERAIGHGFKPAILCNITTAIGLLSLCTSDITPIYNFGLFSAVGVLATLILLFTYLPAALQIYPLNMPKQQKREDGAESWLDASLSGFWERFGRWIIDHYASVATICMLIIVSVGYGVTRINTSVNLLELFDKNAKILKDYRWLENNIGMLTPMEIVLKFSPATIRKPLTEDVTDDAAAERERALLYPIDRMEAVQKVQESIARYFGVRGAGVVGQSMAVPTFIGKKPPAANDHSLRRAADVKLDKGREELLKSDFYAFDESDQSELWRISLRVASFKGVDFGDFVYELRGVVEPVMSAYLARLDILGQVIERRQQASKDPVRQGVFKIGLVMPKPLATRLRPKPTKRMSASEKAKMLAEAAKAAADAPPESIDADYLFAKTLYDSLVSTNQKIVVVTDTDLTSEEAKTYDCLVTLSDVSEVKVDAAKNAAVYFDARKFLADNLTRAQSTDQVVGKELALRPVTAIYTGVVPIVYKAQRMLLDSLIQSTFWSLVTITPLMMFVARGVRAGLVAMLPNALPVLVIFGAMGWIGVRVDIGSMMTASIALGVAVDDTIHYLTWFRQELDRLGCRKKAILAAYQRCATPTLQAATISGLGLSIFVLSTFTPTQRFGYLMLTILFAGVAAELVFLPALLASPLGNVFKGSSPSHEPPDEDDSSTNSGSPATLPLESARVPAAKRIALFFVATWGGLKQIVT